MRPSWACKRHHTLNQQLCRWLLLSLDRLETQELIANMLGVRREGVTAEATKLQKAGLIRYSRGHITVLDCHGLESRSCECYAVDKKEYDRLLSEDRLRCPVEKDCAAWRLCARGPAREPAYPHVSPPPPHIR